VSSLESLEQFMARSEESDQTRRFDARIEALIVDLELVKLRTDVRTCPFIGGSELEGIFSCFTRNCGTNISDAGIVEPQSGANMECGIWWTSKHNCIL
jgi:hypothetical protein